MRFLRTLLPFVMCIFPSIWLVGGICLSLHMGWLKFEGAWLIGLILAAILLSIQLGLVLYFLNTMSQESESKTNSTKF
ncbi:MAG: hypothetical protein NUV84_01950 [Candidatus Uhrbacteria bacterium]|nr:hypothetical protein [Candidatus Uhrbacteria bacterium]